MAEEEEQVSGRRKELGRNCLPCLKKGAENLAEKYCLVCERPFCQECTDLHNSVLGDHRLIEIESEDVTTTLTSHMETCPEHGKVRNLYCTEDEVSGCEMCIDKEHEFCKEAIYLPKAAKKFLKDFDMDEVHAQVRKNIEQLESIKLDQETKMSNMEADRGRCLQQIDNHHTALLVLVDKVVASSKETVETTFQRLSLDLHRHNQEIKKCLLGLKANEISFERHQDNDVQLFVELKKYQKHMKATDEVSILSLENLKVRGFNVAIDNRLHDLLLEIDQLATVLHRSPAKVKETFKIEKDTNPCEVFGACALSDESVLVCDYRNKQLRRVHTQSNTLIDQCAMPAGPCDVCCISRSEVAVAQWNSTVAFVSVKPRLIPTRTISMNHPCVYCAYSQLQLFISDEKKTIYIYNTEGHLLKKFTTDISGKRIFSETRHIVINDEGDQVYVADTCKGLVTMDRQGNVVDNLISDKFQSAWDVCLDGTGGLFVCGFASNNVIHVDADGQIIAEVLASSDGLKRPTSVCFDKVRKRLIVTQLESKQLYVCELE